jgi:predicted RecB family endonuclease
MNKHGLLGAIVGLTLGEYLFDNFKGDLDRAVTTVLAPYAELDNQENLEIIKSELQQLLDLQDSELNLALDSLGCAVHLDALGLNPHGYVRLLLQRLEQLRLIE